MTALVFVDTNVLLYTHDERDLDKQARAREWVGWCWRQRAGRISTQVLNEFYNNAITKFRKSVTLQEARHQVTRLRLWQQQCLGCSHHQARRWQHQLQRHRQRQRPAARPC